MSTSTEYACEVVRITGVASHPNADRLELVTFETSAGPSAYQVVSRRGEFQVHQTAIYLSVDCIVAKGGDARLDFLFELQGSRGAATHRIRAARLRGEYSEGLLIPATAEEAMMALGTDLAERLRVTYYRAPEPGPTGTAATPGSKNSTRDHQMSGRFPVYAIDSLKKRPHLFEPGELVIFTEKIHGTNMRAGWLDGQLVVGSHRIIKSDLRPWWRRLLSWVRREPAGHWYGEDVWGTAARVHQLGEALRKIPGIVCYFELYGLTDSGARIQDLTYGDATLGLTLLDARDSKTGAWLSWFELGQLAICIGVPRVPALAYDSWHGVDDCRDLAEGKSTIDPEQIREGFVARPLTGARRGKLVGQGYLLRSGQ